MPSLEKRLLGIPFTRGLTQRNDPRWLEPGALLTATNVSRRKSEIIEKRAGLVWLTASGKAAGNSLEGDTPVSIVSGARLSRYKGNLLIVGKDLYTGAFGPNNTYGDALWQYDETAALPFLVDRMSEVTKLPEQSVAGGDILVVDMDHAVCNGYRVTVWRAGYFGSQDTAGPIDIYYTVTDAKTRSVVVQPQVVPPAHIWAGNSFSPKVVACGTTVVLMWMTGPADNGCRAATLDCTQPWVGWSPSSNGTLMANHEDYSSNSPPIIPYDMCPVLGNPAEWAFVIQGPYTIIVDGNPIHYTWLTSYRCQVSTRTVISSAKLDNAVITGGGSPPSQNLVQSLAIRADFTNSEMCVACGLNLGGNLSVTVQIQNWPTMATDYGLATDCLTVPGPIGTMGANRIPWRIGIERVDQLSTALQPAYRCYFSGTGAGWYGLAPTGSPSGAFPGADATAYIAGYTLIKGVASPSAMVIQPNQPRVTVGVILASQPVRKNGIAYLVGTCPSYTQSTYFLFADDSWQDTAAVNVTPNSNLGPVNTYFPLRLVATMAPRQGAFAASVFSAGVELPQVLPHLVSNPFLLDASDGWETVLPTAESPTLATPTIFTVDFASQRAYQPSEIDGVSVFAGGAPSGFDGTRVYELGFPLYPIITNIQGGAGGSGTLPNGSYNYIAVFTWRDNSGLEHRSARSVPANVVLGSGTSNQFVTVTVGICGFTGREKFAGSQQVGFGPQGFGKMQNPVVVRLYRTVASGGIYYHVDATDNIYNSTIGVDLVNQQGGVSNNTTLILTDSGVDDAHLKTHSLLYGDGSDGTAPGNVLDDLCPPGFQCICSHGGRIFGADGNTVWASKVFTEGMAPAFNEALAFSIDDGAGYITALFSLDDKLIIAKRDRLFVMTGDGPNDAGGQNNWSSPTRIASDAGILDWRSVAVTAKGAFFMSDNGRRFLTRDLQVVPVTEVEDLDASYGAVSSAIVHPTQNRVLWTQNLNDGANAQVGVGVDHDTVLDTWTQRQSQWSPTGSGYASAVVALTPVITQGQVYLPVYHVLRADGVVGREFTGNPQTYLDGTTYVPMTIDTAWVKAEGIEGFGRFRRLLVTWQNNDAHQLSVYVQYDFDPSGNWILLGTVTAAMMAAMTTKLSTQRFQLPRQRAQAVRFRIVDAQDALRAPVTGQGPTIVSLGLEVGVYTNRRLARVPGSQVL